MRYLAFCVRVKDVKMSASKYIYRHFISIESTLDVSKAVSNMFLVNKMSKFGVNNCHSVQHNIFVKIQTFILCVLKYLQ